ncbi:uncharacterized protein TNCV_4423831 [Trichonephila clavipes]|nr:uncharacterized protein TNCV_4423831 [Trichonephila clavipes]
MCTLKETILVKYAAQFINDSLIRSLVKHSTEDIWKTIIRRRLSALVIPLTLKEEIIALIKPMAVEVENWRADHYGIFTIKQEFSLKFRFNADGTLDRIKTADSLIHSKWLDGQTRFVLACQYWSSWDILTFFEKMPIPSRNKILCKYSRAKENLTEHEENVRKWINHYTAGTIVRSEPWDHFTHASLQSRRLDDLSEEDCRSLLREVFEDTGKVHIGRFCLSRMNADHREQLLALFPLKFLRIYLYRPNLRFFINAANKAYGHLSGKDFTCLLCIIIGQKIWPLWEDFDYVGLLRQFWRSSPDHLKQYVKETDIFEILMEIVKNGFPL